MRTIKIKIAPTDEQENQINSYLDDLTWLWNLALSNQLNNHAIFWYDWASKKSDEINKAKLSLSQLKESDQKLVLDFYYQGSKPKLSKKERSLVDKFSIFSLWEPFDLTGIIPTPLRLGNSPYTGVACQIAYGGNVWKEDQSFNIAYKNKKGEIVYKKGSKLVAGDKPYTRIEIKPHEYKQVNSGKFAGRQFTNVELLEDLKLNQKRQTNYN